MYDKTINIYSSGLEKDTTVLFMLQPPETSGLFRKHFPVTWKVKTFRSKGHTTVTLRYKSCLGFGYSEIDKDNRVHVSAWSEAKNGQTRKDEGGPEVEQLDAGSERNKGIRFVGKNSSESPASLSFGLIQGKSGDQIFEPTHVWPDVGAGSEVETHFAPILTAYIIREYQESERLRGEVETDAIWKCDLHDLEDDVSGWYLSSDDSSGSFSIERANGV